MARLNRIRPTARRRRSGRWQIVALTLRLGVLIVAAVMCLSVWSKAQERSPKAGPATPAPASSPSASSTKGPATPPPPVESNVPVRTTEESAASQPKGSQPTASQPPAGDAPNPAGAKTAKPHRTIPTRPLEIVEALGVPFIIAFGICSVIAVWFSIERLVVLRRGRVIPRPFVERFLQNLEQGNLDPEEAQRLCDENGSPIAQIFAHGVRKWGKSSVEVEQAIIDGGERQVSQLRAHLRVLNAMATITPLIGLLGTVIGMIQCFNDIAASQGMGKADQLAGGIGIALLATAAGLAVAIPSLSMYQFLAGRVDSLTVDLDLLSQNVVHLISAEALSDGSPVAGRSKTRRPSSAEPKERKAV
jgi:biopolymer transport protein ExbB